MTKFPETITYTHIDADNCARLWGAAVQQHFISALHPSPRDGAARKAKSESDWMIREGSDFLWMCSNAGFDGPEMRRRYIAGEIEYADVTKLSSGERPRRRRKKEYWLF